MTYPQRILDNSAEWLKGTADMLRERGGLPMIVLYMPDPEHVAIAAVDDLPHEQIRWLIEHAFKVMASETKTAEVASLPDPPA